ncbi:MAG: type IV pilus assembly protein PilM [Bacillota bacterium]
MGFFSSGGKAAGLELDAGEARVVELRGSARNPVLAAWGRIPLPPGAVEEGMVAQPEVVAAALVDLWTEAGIGTREVILGVANQNVLVRFATFPKVPGNKVAQMIRYQAQEYLPIPIGSVVLDYAVIGETAGETGPLLEVLLVAARREMLDTFLAVLAAARLKPRDIDVSSLALLRALPPAEGAGVTVLVDVANGLSNLLVAAAGVPRLARLLPAGLQDLAEALGCAVEELTPPSGIAAEQKEQTGERLSPEVFADWTENLADELRSSIDYYQAQPGAAAVNGIVLSGRGTRLPGLAARLQEYLGVPVGITRPLEGISVSSRADRDIAGAADFAVCLGLARRGLEG